MALKSSEKTILGIGLLVGAVALFTSFGLPQWDTYNNNHAKETTLNTALNSLMLEKDSLNLQTTVLEKNTNIPGDIAIRTYTPATREEVIKQMLALVVDEATRTGNQLISLTPSTSNNNLSSIPPSRPVLQQTPALVNSGKKEKNSFIDSSADEKNDDFNGFSGANANGAIHSPLLTTVDYDLGIRGSYETLQNFLKVMDHEKTLIELTSITMTYESLLSSSGDGSNPSGSGGSNSGSSNNSTAPIADQTHPIRLTIKVRLAMQPISS